MDETLDQVNYENSVYFKDLKKEKEKEENIWKREICLFEKEKKIEEGKEGQGENMWREKHIFLQ